jgi:taurine transport system permease protein
MTFVIVYTVLFPVVLNTVLGVRSVPTELSARRRASGPRPPASWWEVIIPGALPNIITGLRNGLGYGWRALIAAEIIVGTSGIGFMMFDARRAGSVVEIVVGMIVLGILWYIVDNWILAPIERATGERWGLVTDEEA